MIFVFVIPKEGLTVDPILLFYMTIYMRVRYACFPTQVILLAMMFTWIFRKVDSDDETEGQENIIHSDEDAVDPILAQGMLSYLPTTTLA